MTFSLTSLSPLAALHRSSLITPGLILDIQIVDDMIIPTDANSSATDVEQLVQRHVRSCSPKSQFFIINSGLVCLVLAKS